MPTGLNTRNLEVYKVWLELQDTQDGFYLQRTSGAPLYYLYSSERPLKNVVGHRYVNFNDPTPLVGGRVWLRSDGITSVAYTPYIVTDNAGGIALDIIGDTSQLPTLHKATIVGSIREIFYQGIGGALLEDKFEEVTITAQMILDKQLTLEHTPADGLVKIGVYRGCEQRQNVDYQLLPNSNVVSWETLALELLLEENDIVYIHYKASI